MVIFFISLISSNFCCGFYLMKYHFLCFMFHLTVLLRKMIIHFLYYYTFSKKEKSRKDCRWQSPHHFLLMSNWLHFLQSNVHSVTILFAKEKKKRKTLDLVDVEKVTSRLKAEEWQNASKILPIFSQNQSLIDLAWDVGF